MVVVSVVVVAVVVEWDGVCFHKVRPFRLDNPTNVPSTNVTTITSETSINAVVVVVVSLLLLLVVAVLVV